MANVDLSKYDFSKLSNSLQDALTEKFEKNGQAPDLPEEGKVLIVGLQAPSGSPDFPVMKAWVVILSDGSVLPAYK